MMTINSRIFFTWLTKPHPTHSQAPFFPGIDLRSSQHWIRLNMLPGTFTSMISRLVPSLASNRLEAHGGREQMTKAGAKINLMRWVSPRTIKEVFVPPVDYRYPFLEE